MTPTTALQALIEVSKIARHPDYEWPLDLARQVDAIIARAALSAPAQDAQAEWRFTDNGNGSITVERDQYSCVLWAAGQGGVESLAYKMAQLLAARTQPATPAQQYRESRDAIALQFVQSMLDAEDTDDLRDVCAGDRWGNYGEGNAMLEALKARLMAGFNHAQDAAATVPSFDMSRIESPFNACMHKDYCMSLKAATPPAAPQASPAPFGGDEAVKPMTPGRALYFMERFKHEEKLLGPNEQAAVDFVIAMLEAAPTAPQAVPLTDAKVEDAIDAWFAYESDDSHNFQKRMRAALAVFGITPAATKEQS